MEIVETVREYPESLSFFFLFSDDLGKEIISRFSTDLDTNKTWYTDANGRTIQQRM